MFRRFKGPALAICLAISAAACFLAPTARADRDVGRHRRGEDDRGSSRWRSRHEGESRKEVRGEHRRGREERHGSLAHHRGSKGHHRSAMAQAHHRGDKGHHHRMTSYHSRRHHQSYAGHGRRSDRHSDGQMARHGRGGWRKHDQARHHASRWHPRGDRSESSRR